MPRKFGFQFSMHQQTWQSKKDNHTNQGSRPQIMRPAANGSHPVEPQYHHNQGSSMQIMRPSANGSHPVQQYQYCETREMIMDNHGLLMGQKKHRTGHGGSSSVGPRLPSPCAVGQSQVPSRTHRMLKDASRAASEAFSHEPHVRPAGVTVEEITYQYWRG